MGDRLLILPSVPGHEFISAGSGPAASDLGDDIGDIGLRFEAIELCGLDDGVDGSGAIAACL
ncbi:hypothetical protein K663_03585 [Sphingobium sp. MI1205]|nr:hypothetical protein K663_03585 [Sphingobium sp. MI1205]